MQLNACEIAPAPIPPLGPLLQARLCASPPLGQKVRHSHRVPFRRGLFRAASARHTSLPAKKVAKFAPPADRRYGWRIARALHGYLLVVRRRRRSMPGTLTLHISASSAISDVDNVVVSAEPVAFEGRLKLCEFGRSPANRDVDTTAPKFFQLRGNQLLMGDSASSLNVFCVLNSGYLIRDQPDSIISIFKPGKTKISLQAPSPDEAKQWVTHMRKALIGYRIDKTILESRIQQQAMVKKAMETSRELDDVVVDDDDDDEDTDDDADDGLESAPAADATGCNSSEMVSWQGTWHGPALKGGMRTGLGLYRLGSIVYEGEWDRDMSTGAVHAAVSSGANVRDNGVQCTAKGRCSTRRPVFGIMGNGRTTASTDAARSNLPMAISTTACSSTAGSWGTASSRRR